MLQAYEGQLSTQVQGYMKSAMMSYIEGSEAENTRKAHESDWKKFEQFCNTLNVSSMPASPETVALFLTHMAESGEYKTSTIERCKATISAAHRAKNLTSPTSSDLVKRVMKGIKNKLGTKVDPKKAMIIDDLLKLIEQIPNTLEGTRDKAMLLMGWSGAFRRSELIDLDVEDVEVTDEGLVIHIDKSKTDQIGEGRTFAIARGSNIETCPVHAYVKWITLAGIESGAIFRRIMRHSHKLGDRLQGKGKAVERIVKKYCELAGLDPKQYAAHSLRSGFATTAAKAGKDHLSIMEVTGHKSVETLKRYIHDGNLFKNNATNGLGL